MSSFALYPRAMGSGYRMVRVAAVAFVGIAALAASACDTFPPLARVGITENSAGKVEVLWHSCRDDEEIQRVSVLQEDAKRRRTVGVVWAIEGKASGRGLHRFVVGDHPPDGFNVVVPLASELPVGGHLSAQVRSSAARNWAVPFETRKLQKGLVTGNRFRRPTNAPSFEKKASASC